MPTSCNAPTLCPIALRLLSLGLSMVHRILEEARMEYWLPTPQLTCTIHSGLFGTERLGYKGLMRSGFSVGTQRPVALF